MPSRLDLAYDAAIHERRTVTANYATNYWRNLGSYRDADAALLAAKLVPRIEANQKRVAQITDAYVARVSAAELGSSISRGAVAPASTLALRGVPAETVYQRPFVSLWSALANDATIDAAVGLGLERLLDLTFTGIELAKTHAARNALQRDGAGYFQRTLTGRENCALCVVASTQRYKTDRLLPIHPGCDCGVKPYYGPDTHVINRGALDQLHGQVLDRFGSADLSARDVGDDDATAYRDLIVTHEHGEIGPVLAVRGQTFTGPNDLNNH